MEAPDQASEDFDPSEEYANGNSVDQLITDQLAQEDFVVQHEYTSEKLQTKI